MPRIRRFDEELLGPAFFAVVEEEAVVIVGELASAIRTEYAEGADRWAGDEMPRYEDCCFAFGGYALPLVDAADNVLDESGTPCDSGTFRPLRYHVRSASTCTVKVGGNWRMYLPEPRVTADDDSAFPHGSPWPVYLPADDTSAAPRGPAFPASDWSTLTSRFSASYIAFVDSPDGGKNFPVYGPRVPASATDTTTGCSTAWDTSAADWSEAGWTPTAIPSRTDADDPAVERDSATGKNVYVIYHDPSVIDLYASHGIYVMIVLECRSTSPYYDDTGSSPCTSGMGAYHRIVAFASTSPDFGPVGTSGGTWPDPRKWSEAAVLLDGGGDPAAGTASTETYGVPSALLAPDGRTVLLYVSAISNTGVTDRAAAKYGAGPIYLTPGMACFAIPAARLAASLKALRTPRWDAKLGKGLAAAKTQTLQGIVEAHYQGEVILGDGTSDGNIANQLQNLDAQFAVVYGEIWAFFRATDTAPCTEYAAADEEHDDGVDCTRDVSMIRCARLAPVDEFVNDTTYAWLINSHQGQYAMFIAPDECFTLFDLKHLFGTLDAGLVRDPDVAQLDDGTLRITVSGQSDATTGPVIGNGLLVAVREPGCPAHP